MTPSACKKYAKRKNNIANRVTQTMMGQAARFLRNAGFLSGPSVKKKVLAQAILGYLGKGTKVTTKQHINEIITSFAKTLPTSSKKKPIKTRQIERKVFYESREWLDLRYRALKLYERRCMVCGLTPAEGAQIHVDHIKPRKDYPELELEITNLQILCRECNLGKSNHDTIDWRPQPASNA